MKQLQIHKIISSKSIRPDFLKICALFIIWKFIQLITLVISFNFIPTTLSDKYLGAGFIVNKLSPTFLSFANFDGEHYLSISILGYNALENAFFPLYPLMIHIFPKIVGGDFISLTISSIVSGLFISNLFFLLALVMLYELIILTHSRKVALMTILLLLSFPTAFYFGSLYNESLFLFFAVCSFYFYKKENYFLSGIFGFFSTLTRVFGILIFLALVIDLLLKRKFRKSFIWLFLIPLGLVFYMIYLWYSVGDPIAFYNLQTVVGEQHQKGIILLPQVFIRYLNILFDLDHQNPIFQTIYLEVFIGVLFFILPFYGYLKKTGIVFFVYALFGFLLTTIQGSFSSLPRYVLVLFPSFLAFVLFFKSDNPKNKNTIYLDVLFIAIIILLSIYQIFELIIFSKGFWVS